MLSNSINTPRLVLSSTTLHSTPNTTALLISSTKLHNTVITRLYHNDGTGKGRDGSGGRGRKRKSKFSDRYFDSKSWLLDDGLSPFSSLTPSKHGSSNNLVPGEGKSNDKGKKNGNIMFTVGKDAGLFGLTDRSSKSGSKSLDLWQYINGQHTHGHSGNNGNNGSSKTTSNNSSNNMNYSHNMRKAPLDASSLKDAITLQEHADILEAMLQKSNPRSMRNHLDEFIIGQDKAKETLSCAVYNHYSRVLHNMKKRKEALQTFPSNPASNMLDKSNILILGPSGSGKTLMAKRIAEILQVPFCMNDATTFTQAGYVGDDVEQCISRLLQASGNDVRKTEIGIVFVDEIDKISKRDVSGSSTSRDVAGEGVQQSLLKMLEGTTVHVPEKGKKKNDETVAIDTSNILFILSGAFVGIDKLAESRTKGRRSLGFGSSGEEKAVTSTQAHNKLVTEADLISFGLIPEFVGRIPLLVTVEKLTENELVRILSEPKNSLVDQYTRLFKTWNVSLKFTEESLHSIAKRVMDRQTGARGLKFVMEEILKQSMYNAPGSEVKAITINGDLRAEFHTDSSVFMMDESSGERFPIDTVSSSSEQQQTADDHLAKTPLLPSPFMFTSSPTIHAPTSQKK